VILGSGVGELPVCPGPTWVLVSRCPAAGAGWSVPRQGERNHRIDNHRPSNAVVPRSSPSPRLRCRCGARVVAVGGGHDADALDPGWWSGNPPRGPSRWTCPSATSPQVERVTLSRTAMRCAAAADDCQERGPHRNRRPDPVGGSRPSVRGRGYGRRRRRGTANVGNGGRTGWSKSDDQPRGKDRRPRADHPLAGPRADRDLPCRARVRLRLPAPGSSCSSTGDEAPAGGGSWSSRSSTARLATST